VRAQVLGRHELPGPALDGLPGEGIGHVRGPDPLDDDIARRVVGRALRQIENGPDTEPGEIIPAWLREGESTPVHR